MVVAFDSGVTDLCAAHGVVSLPAEQQLDGGDFRGNTSRFRTMGSMKPKMVLRMLVEFKFQTVVLSDTDVVWLRDPTGGTLNPEPTPNPCTLNDGMLRRRCCRAPTLSGCGIPGVGPKP